MDNGSSDNDSSNGNNFYFCGWDKIIKSGGYYRIKSSITSFVIGGAINCRLWINLHIPYLYISLRPDNLLVSENYDNPLLVINTPKVLESKKI